MKIILIGSGNVATVLGRKIKTADHQIVQVFSPHGENASALAGILNCGYASSWEGIDRMADLYIAAISDEALLQIEKYISLGHQLIVHTAGSVSKEVLWGVSRNYGVLYPLQSLRKDNPESPRLTLLVDGNTGDNITLINDFASSFADRVEITNDEDRMKLHLAAVIVNNFSNHLYSLAEKYCIEEKLDFQLLLPLIEETANRLRYASPAQMQTGPAIRDDIDTIRRHEELLSNQPALQLLFKELTRSIREFHSGT
ncbi:MAG TPA: Rossmann-like and DUF2520 domain-containing protein [Puia sp.]|nr:Rossmann-like and DUF2520 domain-containing protein [Puia sp.]